MKNGIKIIVVDGQPGGGKDEFLRRLGLDPWFIKNAIILMESAAWVRVSHDVQRGELQAASPQTRAAFQGLIAQTYIFMLNMAVDRAIRDGKSVVVCNRFTPSGAMYVPGGMQELCEIVGISVEDMIEGIDHVICPGAPKEEHYTMNEYRFETWPEACDLGARARQIYISLGFEVIDIPGRDDFDEKCDHFSAEVRRLVGAE